MIYLFFICRSEQMGRQTTATEYSLLVWVSIMFAGKMPRAGRTLANRHSACGRTPWVGGGGEECWATRKIAAQKGMASVLYVSIQGKVIKTSCQVSKKCTSIAATPSSTRCELPFVFRFFKEQKSGNCLAKLAFLSIWKYLIDKIKSCAICMCLHVWECLKSNYLLRVQ